MRIHSIWPGRRPGLLIMASCLGILNATGTAFYVATNGSDSNSGTNRSAPFQTIQQAASMAVAGDTCYVCAGVYHETLVPSSSGTSNAPITFSAYSNDVVTLDGADVVTGWTYLSNGIYQASVSWDLGPGNNQVLWMARWCMRLNIRLTAAAMSCTLRL